MHALCIMLLLVPRSSASKSTTFDLDCPSFLCRHALVGSTTDLIPGQGPSIGLSGLRSSLSLLFHYIYSHFALLPFLLPYSLVFLSSYFWLSLHSLSVLSWLLVTSMVPSAWSRPLTASQHPHCKLYILAFHPAILSTLSFSSKSLFLTLLWITLATFCYSHTLLSDFLSSSNISNLWSNQDT